MSLVKVRNNGTNILFIDSLGLILRPSNEKNDEYSLVDEEKANNDPQLMKCKILGSVEFCAMNKEFKKRKTKESEDQLVEPEKPEKLEKPEKQEKLGKKQAKKVDKEEKVGTEIEEFIEPPEPKNSDPVIVVPGERGKARTSKVKMYKMADAPMPKFIKNSDIRDLKGEDVDAESQGEKDIDLSKIDDK